MKYEDIKNLLSGLSYEYIRTNEETNEIVSARKNDVISGKVLSEIHLDLNALPGDEMNASKVNYLIKLLLSSSANSYYRRILFDTLLKYNYCTNGELLRLIRITDSFFEGEISYETYKDCFFGLISMIKIKGHENNKLTLASLEGNFTLEKLDEKLGLPRLNKDVRRYNDDLLTREVLMDSKDLYGAYYNIPFEFFSQFGYSVIINKKDKLVYDCANNVIVPLDIWTRYYGKPSVMIKGESFQEFSELAKNDFGVDLDLHLLRGIQKRVRKQ